MNTIRAQTEPLLEKNLIQNPPDRWILNASEMNNLDDTAIVVLFGDLFADVLSCDMDFTRVHYDELVRLVRDSRATGKAVSLPGLTVRREHSRLVITRGSPQDSGPHRPLLRQSSRFPARRRRQHSSSRPTSLAAQRSRMRI